MHIHLQIMPDGTKHYKKGDLFHRADGPAIEYPNGNYAYYWEGKLHRDGGLPAMRNSYGEYYYQHGKLHRENDLPAIDATGECEGEYFQDNLNSPPDVMIDVSHGCKCWYIDGILQRADGKPAIVTSNGESWTAVNGKPCMRIA